jgi:hypothetical protein
VLADDLGVALVVRLADGEDAAVGDVSYWPVSSGFADPGARAGCMYGAIVVDSMSL